VALSHHEDPHCATQHFQGFSNWLHTAILYDWQQQLIGHVDVATQASDASISKPRLLSNPTTDIR